MVTVSPRVGLAHYERMARRRIERDGVAVFGAVTADGRQRAHLQRLAARLAADPGLRVSCGPRTDGISQLAARPAGAEGPVGWYGDAHGAPD